MAELRLQRRSDEHPWEKLRRTDKFERESTTANNLVDEEDRVSTEKKESKSPESDDRRRDAADPLEVIGDDLMMKVLKNLDARSLACSLLVSRDWHALASSDSLWAPMCEELWIGKAHIPHCSQVPGLSKRACYSHAIIDSKRVCIMREDLCDHAWEFHFTEGAPEYWRNLDHYWTGVGRPMRRYFHPDGSHTADPDDKVWGGHECCYSVVTSSAGGGKVRENYVRVNRWPRLTVTRREDWGWEMHNGYCAYYSISDAEKDGGTGPLFAVSHGKN